MRNRPFNRKFCLRMSVQNTICTPCNHVITGYLNIANDPQVIAFLKKRLQHKINEWRYVIEKSLQVY